MEKINSIKEKLLQLNYAAEHYSIEKKQNILLLIEEIGKSFN